MLKIEISRRCVVLFESKIIQNCWKYAEFFKGKKKTDPDVPINSNPEINFEDFFFWNILNEK